jgi:hypothetical protein
MELPMAPNAIIFTLDVTAAATEVDDTLNVDIQTKIDGTGTWIDVLAFTEVLGNGGALRFIGKATAGIDEADYLYASLAASAYKNILGFAWRAKWVVVDAGGSAASFTFSVGACVM